LYYFVFFYLVFFTLMNAFSLSNCRSLSHNYLTAIPPSVPKFTKLQSFHGNNISLVPRGLSTYFLERFSAGMLLSLDNNPSHCGFYLDPLNNNVSFICLCNVAQYYYGDSYCESTDRFISLPVYFSNTANQTKEWVEKNVTNIADFSQIGFDSSTDNPQIPQIVNVTVTGNNGTDIYNYLSAAVDNAFDEVYSFQNSDYEFHPSRVQVLGYLNTLIQQEFQAIPNPFVPTHFTYWLTNNSACGTKLPAPNGLQFIGNVLSGQPSGVFGGDFFVCALDSYSKQVAMFAEVNLRVFDCGNQTCENKGHCRTELSSTTMTGNPDCVCTAHYKGIFCEETNFENSNNTPTIVGAVVGLTVALFACLSLALFIRRRQRQRKDYHVFISYRVDTDKDLAEMLCRKLETESVPMRDETRLNVKVFWDAKDIQDGSNWKQTFLQALQHSCLFLPIVSEAALEPMKRIMPQDSKPDNVLLEYEVAMKLQKAKLIAVLPLLVGRRNKENGQKVERFNFELFGAHTFPATSSTTLQDVPISTTITSLYANQGIFLTRVGPDVVMCRPPPDPTGRVADEISIFPRVVKVGEFCCG
jgi:hypothetical protein